MARRPKGILRAVSMPSTTWVTNDLDDAEVFSVGIGDDAMNSAFLGQIDNTAHDDNVFAGTDDGYLHVG